MDGPLWTWGIDPAEAGFTLVGRSSEGGWFHRSLAVGAPRGPRRLMLLGDQALAMTASWSRLFPPHTVWVEQPVGRVPAPWLMASWGVILSSLMLVLDRRDVSVFTVTPPEWKKRVGLKGNCGKTETLRLANESGFPTTSDDQADAFCIAWAGGLIAPINPPDQPA